MSSEEEIGAMKARLERAQQDIRDLTDNVENRRDLVDDRIDKLEKRQDLMWNAYKIGGAILFAMVLWSLKRNFEAMWATQ